MASESTTDETRSYKKRRRADQEAKTRERIAAAAVKLHGTIGPARTTVAGVARKAGVQRATVYRHFPTEVDLFDACTAHYWSRHPMPDPSAWAAIEDPRKRLRLALGEMYGFFRANEPMLEKTSRDAPLVPAMNAAREGFLAFLNYAAGIIVAGRPERGRARKRVEAAVGHALLFGTWQSLVRIQGLDEAEAVALMAAMIEAAGGAKA